MKHKTLTFRFDTLLDLIYANNDLLPPDARVAGVDVSHAERTITLCIASEQFDEVEDGLPAPSMAID